MQNKNAVATATDNTSLVEALRAALDTSNVGKRITELDTSVVEIRADVEHLKSQVETDMVVNSADRRRLKYAMDSTVRNFMTRSGYENSESKKEIQRKAYRKGWSNFNGYFGLASYSDLPRVRLDEALAFIRQDIDITV